MADLIAGTFFGACTTFNLERTNYKNLIQKGIIAGGVLWIIHVSVIPKIWDSELHGVYTCEEIRGVIWMMNKWKFFT